MTKQEEIREGLDAKFWERMEDARGWADWVLKYLYSQGVVIKVKCPDCAWSQFGEETVGMTPCRTCDSTGYIIEPLVRDGIKSY